MKKKTIHIVILTNYNGLKDDNDFSPALERFLGKLMGSGILEIEIFL